MSHKATQWLVDVDATAMTHGAFRVLFHLCDCHNPAQGCYPSQAYLAEKAGMARSGVNLVLRQLENAGLISRHQSVDPKTRKQRPTRYMLAFEKGFKPRDPDQCLPGVSPPTPCPDTGHGNTPEPCPDTGHGPVSTFPPEPCPLSGQSRVLLSGHKPVKEPVKNQRAQATDGLQPSKKKPVIEEADRVVQRLRDGAKRAFFFADSAVQAHILAANLLTDQERAALGLAEKKGDQP